MEEQASIRINPQGVEREVVIMMTDMVQYSRTSSGMNPEEIRDFLIEYHTRIHSLLDRPEHEPLEIEPSAGDGCLVIFEKRPREKDNTGVCRRALRATLLMAKAIAGKELESTRMGILLGRIIEATLGKRTAKFGASFAVANRLEELCGYFGTVFLMDREIARRNQKEFQHNLINMGKISLTSVRHPMNIFSLYLPGIHGCQQDVDQEKLRHFIAWKNEAMEFFSGNIQAGVQPDFPRVRKELLKAQNFFRELTGCEDRGIERILEYIREFPYPSEEFSLSGMKLLEKKRDSLGERLFHLSQQLLRAMDPDFYHALVVDTRWEKYFRLEWRRQGETIIQIDSVPDGVYYLDTGVAQTYNSKGELLSTMEAGTVFGEMAYFGNQKRRTATVIAHTDVVLRRISTEDLGTLPVIVRIFERIARARRRDILADSDRPEDKAAPSWSEGRS